MRHEPQQNPVSELDTAHTWYTDRHSGKHSHTWNKWIKLPPKTFQTMFPRCCFDQAPQWASRELCIPKFGFLWLTVRSLKCSHKPDRLHLFYFFFYYGLIGTKFTEEHLLLYRFAIRKIHWQKIWLFYIKFKPFPKRIQVTFSTDQGSFCVGLYHTHLTLCQVWSQQDLNLTVDLLPRKRHYANINLFLFTKETFVCLICDKPHPSLRATLEGTAVHAPPPLKHGIRFRYTGSRCKSLNNHLGLSKHPSFQWQKRLSSHG